MLSKRHIFWMLVLFISFSFGQNFERICDEEVLKEDFNITVVEDACLQTAQKYEREDDIGNASGYYLISNKTHLNIEKFAQNIPKDASGIYSNIGHSYMIEKNYVEGEKYYKKFLQSYHNPNLVMQNDFKELTKLYPHYKEQLNKAKNIWDKLYNPLQSLDTLYEKLDYLKPSKEAVMVLKKIILIKEQYLPHTLSITSDYQSLAIILEEKFNHYDEALLLYGKMLNIYLNLLGVEYFNTATAYYNIANILNLQGKYSEALYLYKKILTIDLKLFGEIHSETSSTYHNMANVYVNLQQFDKALELYQKSLNIYSSLLNEKNEYLTATYQAMANVFNHKGEYDTALSLYHEALRIDLKNFGHHHYYIAALYHNIAYTHNNKGEYIEALEFYNKALEIDLKLFGDEHLSTASTLHAIAYVYHNLGNYDKALKLYEKVKTIDLKILGKFHPDTANTYHHIAYAYQEKKEYDKALKFYEISLEIKEKVLGVNHLSTVSTYHNMANIYEDLHQPQKAWSLYNKTLKIELKILGENHPNSANTYNNLGNLLNEMRQHTTALLYFQKALAINLRILRKNHPTLSTNFHNIGTTHFYLKDYEKAYRNTLTSFNIFLKHRTQTIRALDSSEKKSYLKSNKDIMRFSHLFKTAYFFKPKALQHKMLFYWLNYKGTLFEYQNILSMVKNNPKTPTKIVNAINELNFLNSQLSHTQNQEEEKRLNEKIHTIEIELSKANDSLKSILKLNEINTIQIASHLKPHQLYIDFAKANRNYYLFTIDHQNHISFQEIDENTTKKINQNIRAFRANTQKMADYLQEGQVEEIEEASNKEAKEILTQLYDDIITKYLQKKLKDKTHLIISPDGLLNYLPFEALYSKKQYLIEKYQINYISSGKEFIRQTKIATKKPKHQMVLFANVDFNAHVKAYLPSAQDKTLAPIFGSDTDSNENETIEENLTKFDALGREEIETIQKYYANPIIFEKSSATIENLFNIPSSKIVHLSTHGLFLEEDTILNPMRKSLLVFAGANNNKKEATLSALQLSTLDLKETELVILSACQSGLGEIHNAEGVVGLPKALLQAGAKNVIMSLWTVSNQKTAMLMDYFYANIAKRQNYSRALQNAKIQMLEKHPYYWSAFILSGL